MEIGKNKSKKGMYLGTWDSVKLYVLLAIVFLVILYIVLNVIVKKIKAIYF